MCFVKRIKKKKNSLRNISEALQVKLLISFQLVVTKCFINNPKTPGTG